MSEEYVGVEQAAEVLGYSKRTIYKKLRKGDIPGQKVDTKTGKKWQIKKSDLKSPPTIKNEVVEVREKEEKLSKEELVEIFQQRDQELINKIDNLEEQLQEVNKKLDQKQDNPVKKFLRWLFY